ncbi:MULTISPECIES: sulfate/molybdate ABC transporter ATP-binding protein [unclassified Acidisoma]|jgi:sulfate transport system ATP-binding protein|uniref:sulfate/molybdate ABC transporter ATP-binding protein n=1 Tax=unclassified Acidisoma TaxID=2634065 RepID=UPI00131D9251|nr:MULTISPECIES: sulfate ABC transporter ATP-binding protein [unclassified Acidisoma]
MPAHVAIQGVSRRFGDYTALHDVTLEIAPGELVAVLGPSGSGKTTLLRIVAGLEMPDRGQVLINGEDNVMRPPRERGVGFVFQHFALFRHMTVFENIAFGLRVRPRAERPSRADINKRVKELLDLVQLSWLEKRYPAELSGGQRQRVALARALAIEPRLLLLDEPFGALDAKVRKELGQWLRELHHGVAVTGVLVTHDQEEALELSDRIVLMSQGRVEQVGTPNEVYTRPRNPFVFEFLGETSHIPCRLLAGALATAGGAQTAQNGVAAAVADGESTLFVRPHDLGLRADPSGPATIRHITPSGPWARVEFLLEGRSLYAALPLDSIAGSGLTPGGTAMPLPRRGVLFADGRGTMDEPLHWAVS